MASSIMAPDPPTFNPRIRCQLCAAAKVPPDAADELVLDTALVGHIAAHLHYAPHRCVQCTFACFEPADVWNHVKQSAHSSIKFNANKNAFMEQACNDLAEKCRIYGQIEAQKKQIKEPISVPTSPDPIIPTTSNLGANGENLSAQDFPDYSGNQQQAESSAEGHLWAIECRAMIDELVRAFNSRVTPRHQTLHSNAFLAALKSVQDIIDKFPTPHQFIRRVQRVLMDSKEAAEESGTKRSKVYQAILYCESVLENRAKPIFAKWHSMVEEEKSRNNNLAAKQLKRQRSSESSSMAPC